MQVHRSFRTVTAMAIANWALFAAVPIAFCPTPSNAETSVSLKVFYEPLTPYGYWIDEPTYGRVWRPRDVGNDWRPYTYGRWAYTKEYGWVWVSEEPWGAVAYHYGQWVWVNKYGWVWVPGDVWAPAWVEWCYSEDYIGWSPMAPDTYWQTGYYSGRYDCSGYYSRTVYVRQDRFAGASISPQVVAPSLNASIAAKAVNVTKYSRSSTGIVNQSIDVARLEANTGQSIPRLRVARVQSAVLPSAAISGGAEIRIFQPKVLGLPPRKPDTRLEQKLDLDAGNNLQMHKGPISGIDNGASLPSPGLSIPQSGGIDVDRVRPPTDLGAPALGGIRNIGPLGGGRR